MSRNGRRPGFGTLLTVTVTVVTAVTAATAVGVQALPLPAARSAAQAASVANAYTFLDNMMDLYATGSTTRLVQSFIPDPAIAGYTDAVTYDDALMVDALLARGTADDLARAEVIGNALLYVQAHDAKNDGRLRAAYAPTPLTSPSQVKATDKTSDVGNMAWVGMALVQLFAKTGSTSYLTGATKVANWVQVNAYDTRGAGGYTGGITGGGTKIKWKSTEHNIDLFGFFTMLAAETGDSAWTAAASHAKTFVDAMWDPAGQRFWVGTDNTGINPNTGFQPEDVNSWSYLAFKDNTYAASLDWDVKNLAVTDGAFTGVSFATCDTTKVWFEGTAHLADALTLRNAPGDLATARTYLNSIKLAQTSAPHNNGLGIVAASRDGLKTCDGDKYYAALHVGATAWYVMAADGIDPFLLL
jgi:hypothetical protein